MFADSLITLNYEQLDRLPGFSLVTPTRGIYDRTIIKANTSFSLNERGKAITLAKTLKQSGAIVFLVVNNVDLSITIWLQKAIERERKTPQNPVSLRERYAKTWSGKEDRSRLISA